MSATKCCKAWVVATGVGAVEALKDQGFCRWNHAFRYAKNSMIGSLSQVKNKISSSLRDDEFASAIARASNGRLQKSEESLRTVILMGPPLKNKSSFIDDEETEDRVKTCSLSCKEDCRMRTITSSCRYSMAMDNNFLFQYKDNKFQFIFQFCNLIAVSLFC
ncbi:hypothetical protein ACS0TY_021423 [Phlomoides rotata]